MKNIFNSARSRKILRERKPLHIPDCFRNPGNLTIISASGLFDVWNALYLGNNLMRTFPDSELTVISPEKDAELFCMLKPRPRLIKYTHELNEIKDSILLEYYNNKPDMVFYPYETVSHSDDIFLLRLGGPVCISFAKKSIAVNLTVRIPDCVFPEKIHRLCEALGFFSDRKWTPSVTVHDISKASEFLAPVSHRMLPYIATNFTAAQLLRKRREEIPLKLFIIDDKDSNEKPMSRSVRTAVLQRASIVATDDPCIWIDSAALGVSVIGVDQKGDFPVWNSLKPEKTPNEFLEVWEEFIRKGWE